MRSALSIAIALLAILCLAARDEEERPLLRFITGGFSIAPLEGGSKEEPHQVVAMYLPPSEDFAPNVNVMIQKYKGSLQEYADLSRIQFKDAEFHIISDKTATASQTWEFTGEVGGRNLHFYSKAELGHGTVYLVTATALQSQWDRHKEALKKCVESFRRD